MKYRCEQCGSLVLLNDNFCNNCGAKFAIFDKELSKKQKEYRDFFNKKLKKFGVKSQNELSAADKKKFFKEIEKEWTKDTD